MRLRERRHMIAAVLAPSRPSLVGFDSASHPCRRVSGGTDRQVELVRLSALGGRTAPIATKTWFSRVPPSGPTVRLKRGRLIPMPPLSVAIRESGHWHPAAIVAARTHRPHLESHSPSRVELFLRPRRHPV